MSKFIVFGTEKDPHVSSVVERIKRAGVDTIVVDYFKPTLVEAEVNIRGEMHLKIDGERIEQPFLIWDRVKLYEGMSMYFKDEKRIADLRAKEWRAYYRMVTKVFHDNVVNNLDSRLVMYKPYQQVIATKAGLNCPPSIVTNSKLGLLDFMDREPDIIMKSLSGKKILPKYEEFPIPYNINTMAIERKAVEAAGEEKFHVCPHFAQRHIHKDHELRIVVVNDKFHTFKIPSQVHEYYAIDWRRGNHTLDFTPVDINPELAKKLLKFTEMLGLFSGSIDIIVDTSGDFWFLECNQDGQWGWLDMLVDGAIAQTFADEFRDKLAEIMRQHSIPQIA